MQRDNEPILYLLNTTTNTTLIHLLIVALHLRSALSLPMDDRAHTLDRAIATEGTTGRAVPKILLGGSGWSSG